MGLDMYLNKMPRCKGATVNDVVNIENYIDYIESCKNPNSKAREYSMEEWCGTKENDINPKLLEFYRHFYTRKYSDWDIEQKYGYDRIMDQAAYWRKANEIHNWFVNKVQDGIDDCDYHNEVTKEILEELLDTCERVLADPNVAMELLPTTSGFFFGSTDYDEWYFQDIEYTVEAIRKILDTTDFETEMLYYISSW